MKLLKKSINEKDGNGFIVLRSEEPEDMWHIYNLIHVGDSVRTTTLRKVVKEGVTGSTTSQKIRIALTIAVDSVDFDTEQCLLRIKGRNIEESQHVKMGAYHTIDLELNRDFTLTKTCWDIMSLERIEDACNVAKQADVAAVVMQPGLAHVCLIKGHMTVIRSKIDVNIPRKRAGNSAHAKGIQKFYEAVMQGILRHVDFDIVKCVLIASPGFLKDDFFKYLMEEAVRQDKKILLQNKSVFLLVHSSSGHKQALDEVMLDPKVQSRLQDTKAADDVKCLNDFFEMLHSDPDRAYYGYNHVLKANVQMAIDILLITDGLFRNPDIKTRRKYVDLVESVRGNGGQVRLFSSLHVSGEQLGKLSGVAAILRFPLPDLDEDDEDTSEEEKDSRNIIFTDQKDSTDSFSEETQTIDL